MQSAVEQAHRSPPSRFERFMEWLDTLGCLLDFFTDAD